MTNEATVRTNKGTPATCWKCGELISTASLTFPFCRTCHQSNETEARQRGLTVRNEWCACPKPLDAFYYERSSSLHGWACSRCHGITQSG